MNKEDTSLQKEKFLEKILRFAQENPNLIENGTKLICADDFLEYNECYGISFHLGSKGDVSFIWDFVKGPNELGEGVAVSPRELVSYLNKYLPDLEGFKKKFHFYYPCNDRGAKDLFEKFR